jgi:hypothetical protein
LPPIFLLSEFPVTPPVASSGPVRAEWGVVEEVKLGNMVAEQYCRDKARDKNKSGFGLFIGFYFRPDGQ